MSDSLAKVGDEGVYHFNSKVFRKFDNGTYDGLFVKVIDVDDTEIPCTFEVLRFGKTEKRLDPRSGHVFSGVHSEFTLSLTTFAEAEVPPPAQPPHAP